MLPPPPPVSPSESADPFKECSKSGGCKVVVFQIVDPHDFWNTVEFLSGKTGHQFTLESAAAEAQPKSSQ
jgi:hypothetical protein